MTRAFFSILPYTVKMWEPYISQTLGKAKILNLIIMEEKVTPDE